jgi:hypothetical protein
MREARGLPGIKRHTPPATYVRRPSEEMINVHDYTRQSKERKARKKWRIQDRKYQ